MGPPRYGLHHADMFHLILARERSHLRHSPLPLSAHAHARLVMILLCIAPHMGLAHEMLNANPA